MKRTQLSILMAGLMVTSLMVSGQALAAVATATATATVIAPITVAKSADLSFGKFAPGAGGSVTINTDGTRTVSGTIPSAIGSILTAAKFDVAGDKSATYSISYVSPSSLASTGTPLDTMAYTMCSALTAAASCSGTPIASGTLDATTGLQSIYVGGTLTVAAAQVPHTDYTGTMSVTVEYN